MSLKRHPRRPRSRDIRAARRAKQQQNDRLLEPRSTDDAFGHVTAAEARRIAEEDSP